MGVQNKQGKNLPYQEVTFVTHSDINYASKVIALLQSMQGWKFHYKIDVFCHDEETAAAVNYFGFPGVVTHRIQELVEAFPELLQARRTRSQKEYLFCITPFLIRFIENIGDSKTAIYIDADIFFFDDPAHTLSAFTKDDIVSIVPHRFSKANLHLEIFGKYNVGWIAFKCVRGGNPILEWWMARCIESTSTKKDNKLIYGDQKYLDQFPKIDSNVRIINEISHNVAPWNLGEYVLSSPKTFPTYYHFSGFTKYGKVIILNLLNYKVSRKNKSWPFIHHLYNTYACTLNEIELKLSQAGYFNNAPKDLHLLWKSLKTGDFMIRRCKIGITWKTNLR
jgi:hypothetical protein